jgi:hypothetical protein
MKLCISIILHLLALCGFSQITVQPPNAKVCKGKDTSFKVIDVYNNPKYQWQIHSSGTWIDLTNNAVFTHVNKSELAVKVTEDSLNNRFFRCVIDTNGILAAISDSASLVFLKVSSSPTSVSPTVNPTNCPGNSSVLIINGGQLGDGASWKWYRDSCNGSPIGSGNNFQVFPTDTTAYFVRAEGLCNVTACAGATINVRLKNSVSATAITASINPVTCPGDSSILTVQGGYLGSGATWKWYSGSCGGVYLGDGALITVKPASNTSYFVRAEGTCNTTSCVNQTIIVSNTRSLNPVSIVASSNPISCPGNMTTLSVNGGSLGSGAQWKWYTSSCGGSLIGTGSSLNVNPVINTTYFVRAEGLCNVTNCAQITVSISNSNSIQASNISATVNPVSCPGNSTTLSVLGGLLGTSAQWKWYQNSCAGSSIGTGSSITVSPSSNTSYFVRAEGLCNSTSCVSITINVSKTNSVKANGIIASVNPLTCPGNSTTLSPNGGFLGSGASWNWYSTSCGNGFLKAGNSFTDTLSQSRKYYLRAEGDCNVTLCDSIIIIVSNTNSTSPLSISSSKNPLSCPGESTLLSVNGGSLGSLSQWRWYSDSCGKGSAIGTGNSIIVKPLISTAYYVRAEGPCAPTSCANTIIFVNNTESTKADSIVSTKVKLCRGEFATLTVSGGNLGTKAKWQWYENGCTGKYLGEGQSINVAPNNSTSYFVKAVGTCNITECTSIAIQVFDLPKIDAGKDTSVCSGFSIRFQTISNGSKFSWQPSIGLNDPNLQFPIAGPAVNTTYIVKTIDKNNCSAEDTIFVQVNKNPKAMVSDDTAICFGDHTILYAKGGVSYEWMDPGSGLFLSNPFSATPLAQPTRTTTFKVVVRDINGCRDTASVKVIVNPAPIANAGEDMIVCYGDVVQLNASGGQFYQWENHTELDFPSTSNPKVKAVQTQNYIVTVGNIFGCTDVDSLYLIVNPLPKILTGEDKETCLGDSLLLVAIGGTQYRWSPEIGLSDVHSASTYAKPNQNVKYIVEGKDANNCTNFDSIYITVNPLPILDVSSDVLLCKNDSIQLKVNGARSYVWMPSEGLNQVDISMPTASPRQTTNFIVLGRSADGCSSMDSVLVQVIDNPIPRILSKDTLVCQNSFWQTYSVSISANSKTWKVSGGNIITGQFTEKIKTHWTGSTIGKIYITESLPVAPYCFGSDSLKVSIRSEKAPDRASIIAKANNISTNTLICKDCDFEFTQWGYENKNNQIEINTCKGSSWCSFNSIDTFNFSYWVKIGENENCITKSYFNQPEIVGGFGNSMNVMDLTIHPNPVTNFTQINANWPIEYVGVFNSIGQSIEEQHFDDFPLSFELEMGKWHSGVYFLVIKTSNGIAIRKVIRQ